MNLIDKFIKTEEDAKIALLGTILADGSIGRQRTGGSRNGTNADLEITHTSKNLDYIKLKKYVLEKIEGMTCRIKEHNKKTEAKTYTLFRLSTNRHPWFTKLRSILYDSNRVKLFPKSIIDQLNDFSLFFMYLDDGTLRVRYYPGTERIREARVTFCLDSFTLEEQKYFMQVLKEKYDIDSHFYRHSKNMSLDRGFRVWFNTENTNKLMNIIDKYYELVPSMQYKFVKYYLL